MNTEESISGKRLVDLLTRRLSNGYLEVVALTDSGAFDVFRNDIKKRSMGSHMTPDFASAYRDRDDSPLLPRSGPMGTLS
jgi:hypothetical protein